MQKHVSELYRYDTHVSFEIFPPKTTQGLRQVYQTVANLKNLHPNFFSVTYGAGGSTAEKSLEISSALTNLAQVTCVAHFTCVGMNRDQVLELLKSLEYQGIRNVLALRGDPPSGQSEFIQPENGFKYATELVQFIKSNSSVDVFVAGYPEGHKDNTSKIKDFDYLVTKMNAGADAVITQLFFDNKYLYEFRDHLAKNNVFKPILAGIFPITNGKQIKRISELSGATIPKELAAGLDKYADSPADMEKFGTEYAINQVLDLLKNDISSFHFYTMNRHQQIRNILFTLRQYFPKLQFY